MSGLGWWSTQDNEADSSRLSMFYQTTQIKLCKTDWLVGVDLPVHI